MLADYHVHTAFSDDSEYPMEDCVKRAIQIGLDELCFTEHIDYGVKTDLNCNLDDYMREYERCRDLYGDRITLRFGIEFGMQTRTVKRFQQDFDTYPFDFVILSCHQVDNKEFWTQDFQKGKTHKEYNEKYYEEKHLGCKIRETEGILTGLGFKDVYTFEQMKPIANPF